MNISHLVKRLSHIYCGLFLAMFYTSSSRNGSTCLLYKVSRAPVLPSQQSAKICPGIPPGAKVCPHPHFVVINEMISHGHPIQLDMMAGW